MQKTPISKAQLLKMLMEIKGAMFATITTHTVPNLRKTNNPYYDGEKKVMDVMKVTTMNVTLNFHYENSVNRQRGKEGNTEEFVAQPRKWGERIPKTCLVTHKDKMYVEAKCNGKPQENFYLQISTAAQLAEDILAPFIPDKSSNKEHQGVETEIILRDFHLDSIKEIKMNGNHYTIV